MSSNHKIAKNTLFLYVRMLLVMGVSLYTSRVVLNELGVSDFGIYSIVAGFIALFSFFNTAMTSATQRYLTFDIGKKNLNNIQKTFNATLVIHIGIAILVLILAESIGLWYINNKLVFPDDRLYAVNVVYQLSIASTFLSIIQVPYNSLIIAHEKMNIYAYVGIVEAILKLVIVYLLVVLGGDKLITYGLLTFLVALGIRLFYQFYCRFYYPESKFSFQWDKEYYKELITYSGWNLFGNLAVVAKGQGSNLLLNFFFGTTVNAAYGIMGTVNSAINNFVSNFQMASNPQIIKSYATGDYHIVEKLMKQSSKFSYFLSLLLIAPILLNIDYILKMWLGESPKYSADFIKVILICSLIEVLSKSIMTGITATGKIKVYHIVIGLFNMLIVPISYGAFKIGLQDSPVVIMYIWLFFSIVSLIFRVLFVRKLMNFSIKNFIYDVLSPVICISLIGYITSLIIKYVIPNEGLINFILQTSIIVLVLLICIFFIGIKSNEKQLLINAKDSFLRKINFRK